MAAHGPRRQRQTISAGGPQLPLRGASRARATRPVILIS